MYEQTLLAHFTLCVTVSVSVVKLWKRTRKEEEEGGKRRKMMLVVRDRSSKR